MLQHHSSCSFANTCDQVAIGVGLEQENRGASNDRIVCCGCPAIGGDGVNLTSQARGHGDLSILDRDEGLGEA